MISSTHSTQIKIFNATNVIIFLLILPKFNIIDINNYHQGIRIENFFSIFFVLIILLNLKYFKINKNLNFHFYLLFVFFSFYVGYVNNFSPNIIILIRVLEYATFVIFFSNFKIDYEKIIIFLKLLIIINLLISILQSLNLVGIYSSRGYIEPNFSLWRSAGLFSGSWELSFISSVSFFLIYHKDKRIINLYLFFVLLILYFANNRGIYISFIVSLFFLEFKNIKLKFLLQKYKISHLILFLLIFISISVFVSRYFILEYLELDIFLLIESLINLVVYNENIMQTVNEVEPQYYSWFYRLQDWTNHAEKFHYNILSNFFGNGYTSIYYDSFLIRILFGNGILGFLFLCALCLKIKFYMIIFLFLTSISLDFIASFKIFIVLFIYFQCIKFLEKK